VDNPDGPDEEITIDPLAAPHIPIPRAVAVIAGRILREWLVRNGRRLTWRGRLLAATAAVVVIGALKLAGVIGTNPVVKGPRNGMRLHVRRFRRPVRGTLRSTLAESAPVRRVSFKIGYVAISGTRALVGFTGKICSPGATPECTVNTNPAAIFSAGNTFAALWEQTVHPNSDISSYSLLPCSEAGGK
jgi:hypothetical protein